MNKEGKWIGYCTNVHAGSNLEVTRANLQTHALQVKEGCASNQPMGIGLWLSARAVEEMNRRDEVDGFRDWLRQHQLVPFTFNGFPYGDFHQDVVKHRVYQPTWAEDSRREYSEQLAILIDRLLVDEDPSSKMEASISTLPLGWPTSSSSGQPKRYSTVGDIPISGSDDFLQACATQLIRLAEFLAELEQSSKRLVYFCIEPEPGCILQTSRTCIEFFQRYLLGRSRSTDELVRRYLRICHDVCHSAVMFEDQAQFVHGLAEAQIKIGKIQVSSAVHLELAGRDPDVQQRALQQLKTFHEPRYLHQTVLKTNDNEHQFYEDLDSAISALEENLAGYCEARVHFHVPIFLPRFGDLKTSQLEIMQCLELVQQNDELLHFEAETYAWNVLPEMARPDENEDFELADGIAREINWLSGLA